jgi:hypothetical protein
MKASHLHTIPPSNCYSFDRSDIISLEQMRFFFLVIVALTASMSVSACREDFTKCRHDRECCSGYCFEQVSMSLSSRLARARDSLRNIGWRLHTPTPQVGILSEWRAVIVSKKNSALASITTLLVVHCSLDQWYGTTGSRVQIGKIYFDVGSKSISKRCIMHLGAAAWRRR